MDTKLNMAPLLAGRGVFKFDLLPIGLADKVALDEVQRQIFTDLRTSGHPHL